MKLTLPLGAGEVGVGGDGTLGGGGQGVGLETHFRCEVVGAFGPAVEPAYTLAVFIAIRVWLQWKHLNQLYADNLTLLARLEATYGDALPWVQVENHFAMLEEIQREIAERKREGN